MPAPSPRGAGLTPQSAQDRPGPLFGAATGNPGPTPTVVPKPPPGPHSDEAKTEMLKQIGLLVGRGVLLRQAIKDVGISDSTYYRWLSDLRLRGNHGDPDPSQELRLQRVEADFGCG